MTIPVLTRTVLRTDSFTSPTCVTRIETEIGRLEGVAGVHVGFADATIHVDHDPARATATDLVAAVARTGYTARPAPSAHPEPRTARQE
ncbi:MAG TPA: heavy-metal-associated domain-containing protein [Nocardioidaceae bacterium]|jgi:copper chaperone CopZ